MKKITINDFSGGIQESLVPDDFTSRQWAQLKGIIPSDLLNFESQWPMQTVGTSYGNFGAVYPLVSTVGIFLVAVRSVDGTLWWCQVPDADEDYQDVNNVTWTQITTAQNKDIAGNTINVAANRDYKFLCTLPLQMYKYVTVPDSGDLDNPSKDTAGGFALAQTSGVLINSTTVDGAADNALAQALVAYIENDTNTVRVISFPNGRRFPMHDEEAGDMIKAFVGKDVNDEDIYVSLPEWLTGSPYRGAHPYVYLDINAALLPGAGIIPRANVGLSKGGTLLLGDIEWRSDLTVDLPTETEADLESTTGVVEFANDEYQIQWPAAIPEFSRVVYPYNGLAMYLKDDGNMVGTILNYAIYNNKAYYLTFEEHGFTVGETVEISRIEPKFNGTFEVDEVVDVHCFGVDLGATVPDDLPDWTCILSYQLTSNVATITTEAPHGFEIGDVVSIAGTDAALEKKDHTITSTPTDTTFTFTVSHPNIALTTVPLLTAYAARPVASITAWSGDGTTATFTTGANHSLLQADTIWIKGVHPDYDGPRVITSIPDATSFTIGSTSTETDSNPSLYGVYTSPVGRAVCYDYRVENGNFQTIPNSWTEIWVTAVEENTRMKAVANLNTATHVLNDGNTGPHRGSIYFSTGYDFDMFDPRAVLTPGKSDVQIVGMHQLDDTIVVITTAGSQSDGVFRIRGRIERIIQYGSASDPSAVRIELLRGGLGAPKRTVTTHRNYSTVWSEAGVVVFIDRMGGIWYTNGKECDRIDRFGPKPPAQATDLDHCAELGKHLFVWRDNRLLCLTMMDSTPDGRAGSACWTEITVPGLSGISSMVGAENQLFFIIDGKVVRMTPAAPATERACFNNTPLTITVSTLTAGDVGTHKRTNWHRVGMTFSTPTSCTVKEVRTQSTGSLRVGADISANAVSPDVQHRVTLNRLFDDPGVLGEFIVPAGIGPQALASFTVTFEGYVQLQSCSFWITGQQPRIGDQ